MAQNSTLLWQGRSPYRCAELLSHQVRAHIKHSTITAIVSKIKGRGVLPLLGHSIYTYCWLTAICLLVCEWAESPSQTSYLSHNIMLLNLRGSQM
jgi:hypothetical protein